MQSRDTVVEVVLVLLGLLGTLLLWGLCRAASKLNVKSIQENLSVASAHRIRSKIVMWIRRLGALGMILVALYGIIVGLVGSQLVQEIKAFIGDHGYVRFFLISLFTVIMTPLCLWAALVELWREFLATCTGINQLLGSIQDPQQRQQQRRRVPFNRRRPAPPAPPRQGPPPAKPYLLEALPRVTVNEHDIETHQECPLCKDDLQQGQTVLRLPCSHLYHDKCIEGWLLDKNCTCPLCLWEFPTDDEAFNRRQRERMKNRKPRFYGYELARTPVCQLKQWLPAGDDFVAFEKSELFDHLRTIGAIQVIDEPATGHCPAVPQTTCAASPSPFQAGQEVNYHKGGASSKATILKVHLDGEMEPFYTVLVGGREKQTDKHHLSV